MIFLKTGWRDEWRGLTSAATEFMKSSPHATTFGFGLNISAPALMLCSPMKIPALAAVLLFAATAVIAAEAPADETGFVSLFDGQSFAGWRVGDHAELFSVADGMIVMESPATNRQPAHLFYTGDVNGHVFKNFDLKVDVRTFPKANSGIYFHTEYQEKSWPKRGLECQVNNSHSDWRRTGSLWGISNLSWGPETPGTNNAEPVKFLAPPVKDNEFYTQEIIYVNGQVTVKLNNQTVLEYQMPDADKEHKLRTGNTWLPAGTFALQGHPPLPGATSKVCFKNIRVKVLPD
jgi:Domain of Unknown Function (DUF1080)